MNLKATPTSVGADELPKAAKRRVIRHLQQLTRRYRSLRRLVSSYSSDRSG